MSRLLLVQSSPLGRELLEQGLDLICCQANTQYRASSQRGPRGPLQNKGETMRAALVYTCSLGASGAGLNGSQGQRDNGPVKGLGGGVAGGRQGRGGGCASEQDDFGQAEGLVLNGNVVTGNTTGIWQTLLIYEAPG